MGNNDEGKLIIDDEPVALGATDDSKSLTNGVHLQIGPYICLMVL